MNELYCCICNFSIYSLILCLMVHFTFFRLNASGSHATTKSFHKTEEYSDPDCSFQKTTARFDRKMVELKCFIKEKEGRIALNKGPAISVAQKVGLKKQSPRVLQLLSKDTTA